VVSQICSIVGMLAFTSTLRSLYDEEIVSKRIMDVEGDGNCFYRAVSLSLYGNEDSWSVLHTAGSHYAVSNPELEHCIGGGNNCILYHFIHTNLFL
jgi:hypothetical protein